MTLFLSVALLNMKSGILKNWIIFSCLLFSFSLLIACQKCNASEFSAENQKIIAQETSSIDAGAPKIDDEAASIAREEKKDTNNSAAKTIPACSTFPQGFWVFLLGAYVFLIFFNLSYDFAGSQKVHWFWEALYTVLALLAWYNFDQCRTNNWFAQSVFVVGIIIYAFYLYYFNKNKPAVTRIEKENKTARLPLE